ncbi:MAG TPA: hypothetical protein VGK94_09875 [Candidatus Polarisedimenticolia bacterium]
MPHRVPDHYSMLGVGFSLATDSSHVRDFFRAAYRRFRVDRPAEGRGELELSAVFGAGGGDAWASAGGARLDLTGRPMPENRAFLFLLNALMDQVEGYLLVHGAAFSAGGRGFIVAGPPTAGKSTLALELARRGAILLSDDVAPLDRGTGLLHAFPRAIGIRRDAVAMAGVDLASLPPSLVHALPHKWLVDLEALGLKQPGPDDAPCPVEGVFLLEPGESWPEQLPGEGASTRRQERQRMEIALAEADEGLLVELRSVDGIEDLRPVEGSPFPLYEFSAQRSSRPMRALEAICGQRRDLILFLDEARPAPHDRPQEPRLAVAKWSSLLVDLARELLNRSATGKLMRSCGNLPALMSELGRALSGSRAWLLQPGTPARTADAVFALMAEGRSART